MNVQHWLLDKRSHMHVFVCYFVCLFVFVCFLLCMLCFIIKHKNDKFIVKLDKDFKISESKGKFESFKHFQLFSLTYNFLNELSWHVRVTKVRLSCLTFLNLVSVQTMCLIDFNPGKPPWRVNLYVWFIVKVLYCFLTIIFNDFKPI